MSMTKRYLDDLLKEFTVYTFIKDGCPEDEAKSYEWPDLIEHFFEDDEEQAWNAFHAYSEATREKS